jgi:hypothetical protein
MKITSIQGKSDNIGIKGNKINRNMKIKTMKKALLISSAIAFLSQTVA